MRERLAHAEIAMTLELTYHVMDDTQRQAADCLDAAIDAALQSGERTA